MINAKPWLLMLVLLATGDLIYAQELEQDVPRSIEYADVVEAQDVARAQDKHLALYFYSDRWSTPNRMSAVLPKDWAIQTYLDRYYVRVNIDAESETGQALARRYAVLRQFPVLALVSITGELQGLRVLETTPAGTGEFAQFFLRTALMAGRMSPSK